MALTDQPTTIAPRPWADLLTPRFPGAPLPLIEQTLLTVLRDFCLNGGVWRETTPAVPFIEGQSDYNLPSPISGAEVGFAYAVRDDTGQEWGTTDAMQTWRTRERCLFSSNKTGTIQFSTTVFAPATSFTAYVSIVPLTTDVPDWFRQMHELAIQRGVEAEMWAIPQRPWSNPNGERARRALYLRDRATATARAMRGHTPAPIKLAPSRANL